MENNDKAMSFPNSKELQSVRDAIGARQLPQIIHFADVVNRWVYTYLNANTDWLRFFALLFLILRGGSLTLSELARLMLRSNYRITRLVDSLEQDGLVVRERTSTDRRTVRVKVTSAGLETMRATIDDNDPVEKEIMSCLADEEIMPLRDMIARLRSRLIETTRKKGSKYG
ncbi:MAG: MarR family winged helix-turn-helix transcriptional regulator [Dehalococcoidia bacterium]